MKSHHVKIGSLLAMFLAIVGYLVHTFLPVPSPSVRVRPVLAESSPSTSSATVVTSTDAGAGKTNAIIVRDVDGDTVVAKYDGQTEEVKIRLLGVNTPESVDPRRPVECFGKEASHYTKQQVEGKRVLLVADPMADDVDKYGRSLRNIFLEDGTDFDAKLVSEGYAYAYIGFPLDKRRKSQLTRLQKEAEAAQRGLWDPKTCNGKK